MADEVTAADAATPPQVPELPQDPHEALGQLIVERARGGVTDFRVTHGELMLNVPLGSILDVLAFLKADGACRFALLADLTAVDWPGREKRFDIVYNLLSMYTNRRVRVKVQVSEEEMVPSATAIHACANWFEREVFDMFGIVFTGHPDLRRLLTDYGFQGHPLRKDFVLASRAVRAWPGAVEPGQSAAEAAAAPTRRRLQPPGVPRPGTWPQQP